MPLQFSLSFLIEATTVFLLPSFHFRAALFILLTPQVCLSLLVGGALLILTLAFSLSLLFPLLATLLVLCLSFSIPTLFFSLAALLIVVVLLWLGLRLLLVIVFSLATAAPFILSAHEDGRAQAERHNQ